MSGRNIVKGKLRKDFVHKKSERGLKGPPVEKPLPRWHDVKSEFKPVKVKR